MVANRLSILSNAGPDDLRLEPFPHLVIQNALDADLFAQLEKEFPDTNTVMNGRSKADTWYAYPACHALENEVISRRWREFLSYHVSVDFFRDFFDTFGDIVAEYYPHLERDLGKKASDFTVAMRQPGQALNPENQVIDASLECQFYVNYTQNSREVRGPHVDRPTELFAALLYFRLDEDTSTGGDLEICTSREPDRLYPEKNVVRVDHLPMEVERKRVDVTDVVPYRPNTLVMFLNSNSSLHSISRRSATDVPRRHVNFTADLFQLPAPGLFQVRMPPKKRLKAFLQDQPVVWRLASLIDN